MVQRVNFFLLAIAWLSGATMRSQILDHQQLLIMLDVDWGINAYNSLGIPGLLIFFLESKPTIQTDSPSEPGHDSLSMN